jgi:hypothetical protein
LSVTYEPQTGTVSLWGRGGSELLGTVDLPTESVLTDVAYSKVTKELTFTWNRDGVPATTTLDIGYSATNGVQLLSDTEFSIKLDVLNGYQNVLSTSANGLEINLDAFVKKTFAGGNSNKVVSSWNIS